MAVLLDMKENQKKSFDFAADTTKQLITLSTAIITLTVTFSKDIIGISGNSPKYLLAWTWGIFIASVCFGILTLMALTGTLQPMPKKEKKKSDVTSENLQAESAIDEKAIQDISINKGNIKFLSKLQIFTFVIALIMTVIYGYKSLSGNQPKNETKNTYMIIRKSTLGNDTTTYIDTLYLQK